MMTQQGVKILVVDDDAAMRRWFTALLSTGYEVQTAEEGDSALNLAGSWQPDLVLLDIVMPGVSGYDICQQLKSQHEQPPQVIMVSGKSKTEEQKRAFQCGADDYLIKPIDPAELRSRVQLHCRFRESQAATVALRNELNGHHAELKLAAQQRIEQVMAVQDVAVNALSKVAESRDNETGQHILRMREYSSRLARELYENANTNNEIDEAFLADLRRSAPLHDIGKVGIPDSILLKPGRLTEDEFEVMKRHAIIGADILRDVVIESNHAGFLTMAALIARYHHERWDGTGYPTGLSGTEIPLAARIVAVADVYDALTSERPYKEAWSPLRAKETIEAGSGTQFDPMVVNAFSDCFEDFLKIQMEHAETDELVSTALSLLDDAVLDDAVSV